MPLRQQQQPPVDSGRTPDIQTYADSDGGFRTDFQPLSGITTRMLHSRNVCSTGCRRPSRFLEGTAIPNSVIRRELDTPTPDEEHRAWIAHVMNTVAPRIISRLQKPLKQNSTVEEPAPFDRSIMPTVSEMALQKEREEACKLEKEAQSKLAAISRPALMQMDERSTIAFGKRSTQECIAEAISRSKEIQDIITAKVLGPSFRRDSAPSMEIIRDSSEYSTDVKSSKRGKKKDKKNSPKKSDSQSTNTDKHSRKEDRVLQLIHSIKAGTPAELARQRNTLTTEIRLMEQYRTNLEQRTMCPGAEKCDPQPAPAVMEMEAPRQADECAQCSAGPLLLQQHEPADDRKAGGANKRPPPKIPRQKKPRSELPAHADSAYNKRRHGHRDNSRNKRRKKWTDPASLA